MLRLIAFDGLAGSGKDAIADGLVRSEKFVKLPFALPMKEVFSKVFELPIYNFDVRALKDANLKEPIIINSDHIGRLCEELTARNISIGESQVAGCQKFLGTVLHTPREIMQIGGTDIVRANIDPRTWIKLWDAQQKKYDRVIAPDARFTDEKEYVRTLKGKVLLVKRSGVTAMAHSSENDKWPEGKYDAIVYNDVDLQRIQSEVALWYTIVK